MSRETLLKKTFNTLSKLPPDKVKEVSDYQPLADEIASLSFADYILKKYDEEILQKGIEKLVSNSKVYDFLKDEEDLYSFEDLKEVYR